VSIKLAPHSAESAVSCNRYLIFKVALLCKKYGVPAPHKRSKT
jgi:hypothetical protein